MALSDQWDGPSGLTQGIEDPNLRRIVESMIFEIRRLRDDADQQFDLQASKTVLILDGSLSEPGLAFLDDTDTGLFREASAGAFGIANDGVEWVMFDHIGSNYHAAVDINAALTDTAIVGFGTFVNISGELTVDGASDVSAYFLNVEPAGVTTGDGGGPGVHVATARFVEPDITEGTNPIVTAATVRIENAPTEGDDNYALLIAADNAPIGIGADGDATITYSGTHMVVNPQAVGSGHFRVDGPLHVNYAGPHKIGTGSNNQNHIQLFLGGSFTSGGLALTATGLAISPALTLADGDTFWGAMIAAGVGFGGGITTQGNSETIADVATAIFREPNITVGSGDTITNASTVLIDSAPTEGSNNYALKVEGGLTSVQDLEVNGSLTGDGAALTGMIVMWGAAAAPSGWLLCDGSAVSRTTYSDLFAVIGTTYGAGNGSTTFNVPDLRQRFPMGKAASGTGSTLGGTGGTIDHSHGDGSLSVASHTHGAGSYAAASHSHGDGTLTVASHSHGSGSLQTDSHTHGPGTLTVAAHGHGIINGTEDVDQNEDGVTVEVVSSITSPSSNASPAVTSGATAGNTAGVSGSTGNASPDVTGSTDSAAPSVSGTSGADAPDVTGTTGTANPPFQTFNFIIKT